MKAMRILMIVLVAVLTMSCSKNKKELASLAEQESALMPCQIGRMVITSVDFDGDAYNYHVNVPSKYFDLKDTTDVKVLERLFDAYTTLNKEAKPQVSGGSGLLPDGMQGTGLGLDVATASDGIPIRYNLHLDGAETPAHVVEITFDEGDDLLRSFFGSMDINELGVYSGGVVYVKQEDDAMKSVVSSKYYKAGDDADMKELKDAIARKECKHLTAEQIENMKKAEKNNPAVGEEKFTYKICDVDKYIQDSLCAPMTTIYVTVGDVIHSTDPK